MTDDQDLVTQVQQTKEILDRELKPGSASSRDSRQDTGSGTVQYAKKSWLLLFQTGSYFNDLVIFCLFLFVDYLVLNYQ